VENLPCPDLATTWNEVKQKLTEALALTREILETAVRELETCEKRLKQSLTSVDGTLEKLGFNSGDRQQGD
jgi:hypothetical protein